MSKPETVAQTRLKGLLETFPRLYPDARCELNASTPLELLIATILSAQCTDVQVNKITPGLFRRFPTAGAYAQAPLLDLEQAIIRIGLYRSKARNIQACCRLLEAKHQGRVPDTMAELVALPGVGRKTANVVLGNAFGKNCGLVVDTHVSRLSRRIGLTRFADPVKIEQALIKLVPQSKWTLFSHWLIFHGRRCCKAQTPACSVCAIFAFCARRGVRSSL